MPKFIDLLTSSQIWLSNAEILAKDDPHEGSTGAILFPHRMWNNIEEVPEILKKQIIGMRGGNDKKSPDDAFKSWYMGEEQMCLMTQFGRRQFYVNCWHAAAHESMAMWKIYGSPGAGVAIITNGGRLDSALSANERTLHLGAVRYVDPGHFTIGASNVFDIILRKRAHYAYEQEVRLVFWDTAEMHDPLESFTWNKETMRFENIKNDDRPIITGVSLGCDVDTLIESVIISPLAPPWYLEMIEKLKKKFNFKFPVRISKSLTAPTVIC